MNQNHVVLITGASGGIGSAIAIEFASLGYNLVLNYNNSESKINELCNKIKENYNVEFIKIKADLRKEEDITKMVDMAISKFQKIDVLVNNAAIEHDSMFFDKTKQEFLDVLDVNLVAPFLLCKYVSKYMLKQRSGKIINIASTNGIDTYYKESMDYDASKAALISLTHNLALEFAPYINVNAIAPGWTDTDMNKLLDEDQRKAINKSILMSRFGKPEEIAHVVAFLASDKASYINNEVIRVDGGSFNGCV